MTIQAREFDLLVTIYKYLRSEEHPRRPELAPTLLRVINRMEQEREREWAKGHRPKPVPKSIQKRLEKDDNPLMQRLLDAGYPQEGMDHQESDLYVYVTPLTTEVIGQWCREHEYDRTWHFPIFFDKKTGRLMFDCVFQYIDRLAEKTETAT